MKGTMLVELARGSVGYASLKWFNGWGKISMALYLVHNICLTYACVGVIHAKSEVGVANLPMPPHHGQLQDIVSQCEGAGMIQFAKAGMTN